MNYNLDINDRPYKAIKSGRKKIETRTVEEEYESSDYSKMNKGDTITFENNETKEYMTVLIQGVRHYPNVASLFDAEGQDNCMSYDTSREEAIKSYNKLTGYTNGIKKNGIYAIELKLPD